MKTAGFNLAKDPFLATRRVDVAIVLLLVAGTAMSWFNVSSWLGERRGDSGEVSIPAQEEEIRRLKSDIETARKTLDAAVTPEARAEAEQINQLIVRRTFSWVRLLERLEGAMPDDVALLTVTPELDEKDGGVKVNLRGLARTPEGMLDFIDGLWSDPAFSNPYPRSERDQEASRNVDGREFGILVIYHPDRAAENPRPRKGAPPRRQAPAAVPPAVPAAAAAPRGLEPPRPAPAERALPDPSKAAPPPVAEAAIAPPPPAAPVPGASVPGKVFSGPAAASRLGGSAADGGAGIPDRRIPRRGRTVQPPPDAPRSDDGEGGDQ